MKMRGCMGQDFRFVVYPCHGGETVARGNAIKLRENIKRKMAVTPLSLGEGLGVRTKAEGKTSLT